MGTQYEGLENLSVMSQAHNYNRVIYNWLKSNVDRKASILDFGSGIGEFCNRFVKDGYQNIYSVEIDRLMHTTHICPATASLDDYEIKFDLIYSCNVLEHIEDDHKIMIELFEHLQPGGEIRIFVPAIERLYSDMDKKVGHFRRYEKKQLVLLAEETGFNVSDCRYFDFGGFFATLAYKWTKGQGTINPHTIKLYDRFFFPVSFVIDRLTRGKLIGKNLILIGKKPL